MSRRSIRKKQSYYNQQPINTHILQDDIEGQVLKIRARLQMLDEMTSLNKLLQDKSIGLQITQERKDIQKLIDDLTSRFGISLFEIMGKIGGELLKNQLLEAREKEQKRQGTQEEPLFDFVDENTQLAKRVQTAETKQVIKSINEAHRQPWDNEAFTTKQKQQIAKSFSHSLIPNKQHLPPIEVEAMKEYNHQIQVANQADLRLQKHYDKIKGYGKGHHADQIYRAELQLEKLFIGHHPKSDVQVRIDKQKERIKKQLSKIPNRSIYYPQRYATDSDEQEQEQQQEENKGEKAKTKTKKKELRRPLGSVYSHPYVTAKDIEERKEIAELPINEQRVRKIMKNREQSQQQHNELEKYAGQSELEQMKASIKKGERKELQAQKNDLNDYLWNMMERREDLAKEETPLNRLLAKVEKRRNKRISSLEYGEEEEELQYPLVQQDKRLLHKRNELVTGFYETQFLPTYSLKSKKQRNRKSSSQSDVQRINQLYKLEELKDEQIGLKQEMREIHGKEGTVQLIKEPIQRSIEQAYERQNRFKPIRSTDYLAENLLGKERLRGSSVHSDKYEQLRRDAPKINQVEEQKEIQIDTSSKIQPPVETKQTTFLNPIPEKGLLSADTIKGYKSSINKHLNKNQYLIDNDIKISIDEDQNIVFNKQLTETQATKIKHMIIQNPIRNKRAIQEALAQNTKKD